MALFYYPAKRIRSAQNSVSEATLFYFEVIVSHLQLWGRVVIIQYFFFIEAR